LPRRLSSLQHRRRCRPLNSLEEQVRLQVKAFELIHEDHQPTTSA